MTPRPALSEGDTIARNAAMALAAQITTAVFTAGLTLYLVRALGPDSYGLFSLALALAFLILQPSDLGLTQSAARFLAEHRRDRSAVASVFAVALRLKLISALLISGALFGLAGLIADAYGQPGLAWPLRAMAVAMLAQNVVAYCGTSFIALRRTALNFRVVLSESAIEFTATVALVALGGGAAGAAWGRAIGYAVGAAIGLLMIVRLLGRGAVGIFASSRGQTRRIARYAGAMLIIDGAFQALTQVDAIVIGALLNATQVGLFQAPVRLLTPLAYPGLAIAQAIAPRLSRGHGEPDVRAFESALRYVLIIQSAIAIPIIIWAEPITNLLLGSEYAESTDVLRALGPYVLIFGFAPVLSLPVNYLGEARRRIPIAIGAVVLNLVIDLALIPEIGIVGAAIGTNVALLFYTAGHLWICRRLVTLSLRPLVATGARTITAALPMCALMVALGTSSVGVATMIIGALVGWALFAGTLLVLGEFSVAERAWIRRAAGRLSLRR